ncbi:MAG: hydroxymethylglutaryl-CoA lyase, partial [Thermomicrobiales bacterium]
DEICLADTIGVAVPADVRAMVAAVAGVVAPGDLALHFHDTSGNAVANVETALDAGVRIFDAAAGGLGGCPFAPGAPGNLATESLVARLDELGVPTGVDLAGVQHATALLRGYVPRLADSPALSA